MSEPFPFPQDQVVDYAQGDFSTPASIAQQNLQFVLNQQFEDNEPLEESEQHPQNDIVPSENNGSIPEAEEKNLLWPVLPGESGEGLPYAPIDWPYPGDFWTWRVGRRLTSSGFFQDRFLYLPKRLGKQCFASQAAVGNYIKANFPDADLDAFFASFAWKIPVKTEPPPKELPAPPQEEKVADQEETKQEELTATGRKKRSTTVAPPKQSEPPASPPKRAKRAASVKSPPPAKRTKQSAEKSPAPTRPRRTKQIEEIKETESTPSSTANRKTRQTRPSARSASKKENGAVVPEEPVIEPIPENFDDYLSSLDDILSQPISLSQLPNETTDSSLALNEFTEARSRLSSLLGMDFPSLILSTNISELAHLASKLRSDPRLNAEQLVKLKLIEEIPTFSEVFLESKELIAQVDEFFATLESKKNKAASLKSEYNELKEKTDQLQSQVDLSTTAVQEIDEQIAQLQARRAELTNSIKGNKAAKTEVLTAQTMVANAIPKVVQQIQLANAKMPELEMKKTNAMKREAEILAKFAPLQGFAL
ncbi:uncharacterized protein [Euphorbia lathyris]|uniref:uncharacterized protein n=1 Tax=Euphorbia lathyris TaxID=212925 RepID=UPI00331338B1